MPSEDYIAVSSGALKLKGVNSSSKIHKKKKRPKTGGDDKARLGSQDLKSASTEGQAAEQAIVEAQSSEIAEAEKLEGDGNTSVGKTETEIQYQEMRRKRLNDRLKKEGTKTHKERVEELNRYLNKLSEHHDMYVIFSRCNHFMGIFGAMRRWLTSCAGRKSDLVERTVIDQKAGGITFQGRERLRSEAMRKIISHDTQITVTAGESKRHVEEEYRVPSYPQN